MVELVIKIPKDTYTDIIESGYIEHGYIWDEDKEEAIRAIKNGTPLPKGHGRLIDENDVVKIYDIDANVWWENALGDIKDKELVPTIIEADTESEK